MSSRILISAALAGLLWSAVPHAQQAVAEKAPTTPILVKGSKVWLGREVEFEKYIQTAKIVKTSGIGVGVTHPHHVFFADGGLAGSAVFKPLPPGRMNGYWESYKAEIAAYELDKMMSLGMVPPTVERKVDGETGSIQLWVDHCVLLKTKDTTTAPDILAWNKQVYRQRIWDNLIANIDRNQGNLLLDEAWDLILIDHSRAFTAATTMPFPMQKIDREFYAKLKALNGDDLKAHLGRLLFDGPKPLLSRRDKIIEHFDGLIAKYGDKGVFID